MNRIDQTFERLKKVRQKAFIAFLTAGDPSLKVTEELVVSFEQVGVDIVEIGVPFSDPLADGPTIQAASQRALNNHVTLAKILQLVKRIRTRSQIPLALMTYYNPIFHFGEEKFLKAAKAAGVDGVIVPDLPPEEAKSFIQMSKRQKISTIFFLAPTTTKERMKKIVQASTGFIYYVSVTGVTGARQNLPIEIARDVKTAKKFTKKPICVGFGVSTPEQVKSLGRVADGVIVGSAIIKEILRQKGKSGLVNNVSRFVQRLVKGSSSKG